MPHILDSNVEGGSEEVRRQQTVYSLWRQGCMVCGGSGLQQKRRHSNEMARQTDRSRMDSTFRGIAALTEYEEFVALVIVVTASLTTTCTSFTAELRASRFFWRVSIGVSGNLMMCLDFKGQS